MFILVSMQLFTRIVLTVYDEVLRALIEGIYYIFININSNPYILVFIASLIGNSIPYAAVPYYLLLIYYSNKYHDPLSLVLIAITSGVGSTIGKIVIYLIGRGISKILPEENRKNVETFGNLIKRWGFLFVLVATSTPIPDDVILIPIAFTGYSASLYFLATLLGKTLASLVIVFLGRGFSTAVEDVGIPQYLQIPLLLSVSIILIIIIMKIDWISIVREYQVSGLRGAITKISQDLRGPWFSRPKGKNRGRKP